MVGANASMKRNREIFVLMLGFFLGLAGCAATFANAEQRTVRIDTSWLGEYERRFGAPPYILDAPNSVYVLDTDITVEGTAFVIGVQNVTLDLNGHQVTYGNGPAVEVPNGGFERGKSGWDLEGARNAEITPNEAFLFGKQVLRIKDFNTKQLVRSSRISIPRPDHTYVATITPGNRGHYRTKLMLSVVDADSGETLKYYDQKHKVWRDAIGISRNVERGFSAVAHFWPKQTHTRAVYLEVTLVPGKNDRGEVISTTVDLDAATVMPSYDYGVLATRRWLPEVPGTHRLSDRVEKVYRKAKNFTLLNGKIYQGQGNGYGSIPLLFDNINGLVVDRVHSMVKGMDTGGLSAGRVNGADERPIPVVIRNSTFEHDVENISNRMSNIAAIKVSGKSDITIEGNTIINAPQIGIAGGNGGEYKFQVLNNNISHRAVVTNGYGIVIVGIQNFDIGYNTVKTQSGRGIMVDGYTSAPTENGTIHHNHVEVQEGPNREYVKAGETRALRIRNNVDAKGPHRNVYIHDNTFIARTKPGRSDTAYGGQISYVNKDGQMNDANIVLERNTFKAVASQPSHEAKAFTLAGVGPQIDLKMSNNTFESNHIALQITDSDGGDTWDARLIANHIVKTTEGAKVGYESIRAGWGTERWARAIHNVQIIGTRFVNGATADIVWDGDGEKDVTVGWLLNVIVQDGKSGIPHAVVEIYDKDSVEVFTGTTSEVGEINEIQLISTKYQQRAGQNAEMAAIDANPFTIKVTANDQTLTREVFLNQNATVEFDFAESPNG